MTAAAIQGTYSDYRRVKGRKVLQLIVEVPIEQAPEVHAAFGEPSPDGTTWVAVARINPNHDQLREQLVGSVEMERRRGGRLAQRAGLMCQEPYFWRFLSDRCGHLIQDAIEAADVMRDLLKIGSRADLDHDPVAADAFRRLDREYGAWVQV